MSIARWKAGVEGRVWGGGCGRVWRRGVLVCVEGYGGGMWKGGESGCVWRSVEGRRGDRVECGGRGQVFY